ncbi:MAG TPA: hypothetical protein DDW20_05150 [Firmicutes bacterium]|nr:hypothetical protein [Bacillota bacterium]
MFVYLSNKIKKTKKITQFLICLISSFCSSCVCFCSGIMNENAIVESAGVNISEFVSKNSNTDYISVQVSPKDEETKSAMPNTYNEYYYWKYIFRKSNFSFLSTVNGGKTNNCFFKEINVEDNISFICCGNNYNTEYEDFYKHEVYDIKLMFKGNNIIGPNAINFFAISQTRANQLLFNRGERADSNGNYNIEQYEKLLGTNTQVAINNSSYLFTISNVYFESGQFHENVSQNFGEYVISYILFPKSLKLESTYIFNKYDYQNMHKIKKMKSYFQSNDFSFSLSSFNLKNKSVQLSDVFDYNYIFGRNLGNSFVSILLFVLSFVMFLAFLIVLVLSISIHNLRDLNVIFCSFLLPYIILFIINSITKIPLVFSYFSLVGYLVMFVLFIIVLLIILFRKRGNTIRKFL